MRLYSLVCLASVCLILASCDSGKEGAASPTAPAATAVAPTEQAASAPAQNNSDSPIWLEPAALSVCGRHETATVHWDARKSPDAKIVDVYASKDGKEALFAKAGAVGSKLTGPWMHPGAVMVLRNHADSAEIARATMGGIPCSK